MTTTAEISFHFCQKITRRKRSASSGVAEYHIYTLTNEQGAELELTVFGSMNGKAAPEIEDI